MGRRKTAPAETMESPRLLNEPSTLPPDDGNNEYGKKYDFSPDFEGPVKDRSCTDILCLLLFLAFLGGWGFVAYIGVSQGDIDKVRKLFFVSLGIRGTPHCIVLENAYLKYLFQ